MKRAAAVFFGSGKFYASFPLTPALSLGERENSIPLFVESEPRHLHHEFSEKRIRSRPISSPRGRGPG
jgi:hypothetical protein